MKKLFSLLLALVVMAAAAFAAAEAAQTAAPAAAPARGYEPYAEPITITKGVCRTGGETFPEGDSFANNVFLRYAKQQLNIDVKVAWEVDPANFNQKVAMCLVSDDLPDILAIDRNIFHQLLDNDLIQPLTKVYNENVSDFVKKQYDSYPDTLWKEVTKDGEIYGLPGTELGFAHNVLWIRTDWLEKSGKQLPKTLDEVMDLARTFIKMDLHGAGANDTIGITCPDSIFAGYNSNFGLDTIFGVFNSYPGKWVYDKDGKAVYGSVTEETKQALKFLADAYKEGVLDKQFAVRTNEDRDALLAQGKCGMYFGVWWPNGGMQAAVKNDKNCDWVAVSAPVDAEGHLKTVQNDVISGIAVVSKKCAHPEAVIKLLNVQNDVLRGNGEAAQEPYKEYINSNIGWASMPIPINIDYYNSIELILEDIKDAFAANGDPSKMTRSKGFDEVMKGAWRNKQNPKADPSDYLCYASRIVGPTAALDKNLKVVPSAFYGTTDTMTLKWANLQKLEGQAFLKIVMGEQPIDYFDTFVKDWYNQGGDEITAEVQAVVDARNGSAK